MSAGTMAHWSAPTHSGARAALPLSLADLLAVLFPVLLALCGAALGFFAGGSGRLALGAATGFLTALVIARIALALPPGAPPVARITAAPSPFNTSPQEQKS